MGVVGNSPLEVLNNTFVRNKAQPIHRFTDHSRLFDNSYLTLISLISKDGIFENQDLYQHLFIGGAIVAKQHSNVTLNSSKFLENEALLGGTIFGIAGTHVEISQCHIQKNVAKWAGGSILGFKSSISIRHSTFMKNQAEEGGSLFLGKHSFGFVFNSSFNHDVANSRGGAVATRMNTLLNML